MDFLSPSVFLFSAALVSLSIMLMLAVSRPGLPGDQPALALWLVGDCAVILHRVVLLLQPGVMAPRDSAFFNPSTLCFVIADAAFLVLAMAIWAKSLSLICDRPLGRMATTALLASPVATGLTMFLLQGVLPTEIVVFLAGGVLAGLHIVLAWRKRRASRGLMILTVANSVIVLMMIAGLLQALGQMHDAGVSHATARQGPFFPSLPGIASDFVASIVRTFAISLVLQERQRAHITLLSTTDPLTGALNRRGAMPLLQQALEAALRCRQPISLAVLDIDHFKRVNDQFGHDTGDAVLAAFSQCLKTNTRHADVLARWGGEEFVLLMPATSQREAVALLDRIRESLPTLLAGRVPRPVSFSAGVSSLEAGAVPVGVADLLAGADRCLYRAKLTRNCVVAGPAEQPTLPAMRAFAPDAASAA